MQGVADVTILSGTGRYSDPWHPFASTSAAIADIVAAMGLAVAVRGTGSPESLAVDGARLVVVNTGKGQEPPPPDPAWSRALDEFGEWIEDGGRILAVHTAAAAFPDWPAWAAIVGGSWVEGRSSHPRISVAAFTAASGTEDHPVLDGLPDAGGIDPSLAGRPMVLALDERYSGLDVAAGSVPLLTHELEGRPAVMAWVVGRRVLYDGLGHDERSYRSTTRRRLLENEVRWLLDG